MDGIVWFTIAMVAALAAALTLAVFRTLSSTGDTVKFDEALSIIQSSELMELDTARAAEEEDKKGFSWNRYWLQIAEQAGRTPDDATSPGRFALGALIIGAVFGFMVYPGGIPGIAVGALVLLLGYGWLSWEAGKRRTLMESQMPLLLSSLRSHIHAGVTPQAALIAIADDMPAPLGDEVRMLKQEINVSIKLDEALDKLARRVKSRQMAFLVSSIEVSVRSGSDLTKQLTVIQEISEQRARIEGKIKSSVALAKPTAILAMGAPVLMLLYFMLTDPLYITYFLNQGLLLFLAAIALYVAGVVTIRVMIKNVENT